jgi:hypothetical protein
MTFQRPHYYDVFVCILYSVAHFKCLFEWSQRPRARSKPVKRGRAKLEQIEASHDDHKALQ